MLNEKLSNSADENSEVLTDCNHHSDENCMLIVDHTQNGVRDILVTWENNRCPCAPVSLQEAKG
jgi:hypothetical protein